MAMFTISWLTTIFTDYRGYIHHETSINEVTTDSRKKTKQSLFIPLIGDKFDGHLFLEQAIKQGAAATIWDKKKELPAHVPNDFPVFFVEDTLKALQRLASAYRYKVNPTVIGITGSNGKTTTKDIVKSILSSKFKTHATEGNLNNHIGVPLTILSMKQETEMLVLEMGMNDFNEIDVLSRLAEPDYAIITNIGESHIEYLGSREGIAKAKLEITHGLKQNGSLIIDGDEELLTHIESRHNIIKCGFNSLNDVLIDKVKVEPTQTVFHLSDGMNYVIPLLGRHHAKNASFAIALGKKLGIPEKEIKKALQTAALTAMRFEMSEGKNGVAIINDAYNASPTSMKAAIKVVKEMPGFKNKVLVLGDIFELGQKSLDMHKSIAEEIERPITALLTYGNDIKQANTRLQEINPGIDNHYFKSTEDLIKALEPYLNQDSIILFKASRGMAFETLIDQIQDDQVL